MILVIRRDRSYPKLLEPLAFILTACCWCFSGCDSGSAGVAKKPRFAFIINVSGRFWDIAHAGCLNAGEEEGVEVEFHVPGESTAAQQKQMVEALVSKGIQGIAITPLNPESMGRVLDEAAQYMPLLCMDSDAPNSQRLCYIGTDNIALGRAMGEAMKRALPDGGEVAIFVGQLDVGNARERQQGVLEALRGSHLKMLKTFTDQADRPTAKANVIDALSKYPNLKGIIGLWGYNAPAAAKALEDNPGKEVKIVGCDEDIETLDGIRAGKIFCSIAQQPYEFGYRSIKILARLNRKEAVDIPENKLIFVPILEINRDNVDAMEKAINEKLALRQKLLSKS
ncbi:MAG: sugar-binding protein [Planctomycetes bacterium]|nr:sugar-binding protein [Planctomycetota bacterium]